ncbi:MAG: sulfite exporter TauE/SafE family protein [Bacteriovoracaceae bacterium]|nr:sulfite exporter TauE/SafE family protein [Bacteriovoracaceae bacterium]
MKKLRSLSPFSLIVLAIWFLAMSSFGIWDIFNENYFMTITMAFGSFIAGATSEGGGAVAFPVMTLLFKIAPETARDFSLLIQSFGMTAASLVIIRKQIPIVKKAVIYSSLGAILGNIIAFNYLTSIFSPAALKIFFCSFWMAFAFVLIKVKWQNKTLRNTKVKSSRKNLLFLFGIGTLGGMISALTGSGLDIMTFALLTLYFNICEKVATPTSVILMAVNSITCVLLKQQSFGGIDLKAFEYMLVCVPVVIFGAPLGSIFIKNKGRKFITAFLLTTISIQFITALIVIPLTTNLILLSLATLVFGLTLFQLLSNNSKDSILPHNKKTNIFQANYPLK